MEKRESLFDRFHSTVSLTAIWLSGIGISIVCVLTVVDAMSRNLNLGSVYGAYDMNLTLLVALVFLPMGYVQALDRNPAFTLVFSRLNTRYQTLIHGLNAIFLALLVGWVTVENIQYTAESWASVERRMGIAEMLLWPSRLIASIGLLLLTFTFCYQLYRVLVKKDPFKTPETDDSWL